MKNAIMNSTIQLKTNDDTKVLEFHQLNMVGTDGCTCRVRAVSGGFSYEGNFSIANLRSSIDDLKEMSKNLEGKVSFGESYNMNEIVFTISSLGKVLVEAKFSELSESIEIEICTDQTVLEPLIKQFERLAGDDV